MRSLRKIKPPLYLPCVGLLVSLSACQGEQSVYSSAGPYAEKIVWLTHLMVVSASLITLFVMALTALALFGKPAWRQAIAREKVVVWGGIVFPVTVLTVLLIYGFVLLADAREQYNEENTLHITVVGEQWWWRFIYTREDGSTFQTANEMRIPTNRPVSLKLITADVIHSFWIPAYGGKLDMIPGRENTLDFFINKEGVSRGQCAEYCGGAHALMSMYSVALSPSGFEDWFHNESGPANPAADQEGKNVFNSSGCGSCHNVRGTQANGEVGPDLTHVGSRISLGAGILKVNKDNFEKWIAKHQRIKPDNLMPDYEFLTEQEVRSLARYLNELK